MERSREQLIRRARLARVELIDEITLAAQRIGEARGPDGELVFPTDAETRLLRAVERSQYRLAIANVARVLRVSRQAAHRVAYSAAALGRLERRKRDTTDIDAQWRAARRFRYSRAILKGESS